MPMTVEQLLAEAEIRKLQVRYCRACDRADFDLLRSCFHPDATTDYGYFGGDVDQFIASAREQIPGFVITTHNTGNQLVEVDGDRAWAEHYTVATHRITAGDGAPERDLVTAIRYIDRLEKRDGEWRILRRRLVLDWARTDPVPEGGILPAVTPGRQGRDDWSYATD